MSRLYTTKEEIENYLSHNIDEALNPQLNKWIETASRHIENQTKRWFLATEPEERYFDGRGSRTLQIDDCVEVTKVEEGSNYYGDSFIEVEEAKDGKARGYILLPKNAKSKEQPFQQLFFRAGIWIKGLQNHRVTAKWGYSETPPQDIVFATTVLVSGMMISKTLKSKDEIASEKIGNYNVAYKTNGQLSDFAKANQIIGKYKKYYL